MALGDGQLSMGGGEASGSDQGSRARPGTVLLAWLASRRTGNSQLVNSPWRGCISHIHSQGKQSPSQSQGCSMKALVSVRPPEGQASSSTAESAWGLRGREP